MEDVSNVSHSDGQQVLKDIGKSNINVLIFGQLNINSLRNKFDMVSELIKGFVDVFMISETKLDDSFPEGQFFIDASGMTKMAMVVALFFTSSKIHPL